MHKRRDNSERLFNNLSNDTQIDRLCTCVALRSFFNFFSSKNVKCNTFSISFIAMKYVLSGGFYVNVKLFVFISQRNINENKHSIWRFNKVLKLKYG